MNTKSQYIQMRRKSGFNLQSVSRELNDLPAVLCVRPGRWGNPFKVFRDGDARECVAKYRAKIDKWFYRMKILDELTGKNLSCFCKPGDPCHVQDVPLPIVNAH